MMLVDKLTLLKLTGEYTLEALMRVLVERYDEERMLAALAEILEKKGMEEKCSGCRAAAQVLSMLSHDDAQRPYVTGGGVHCPNEDCESTNIEGGSFDTDKGVVTQNMICYDCGSSWVDEYILVGYRDLETDNQNVPLAHCACPICGECATCNFRPCSTDDGIHTLKPEEE